MKGKVTKSEAELHRFGLDPSNYNTASVPWQLTTSDLKLVKQRLTNVHIPSHVDCNPYPLFSHPSRLKSHDWKQVLYNNMHAHGQKQQAHHFFPVF